MESVQNQAEINSKSNLLNLYEEIQVSEELEEEEVLLTRYIGPYTALLYVSRALYCSK